MESAASRSTLSILGFGFLALLTSCSYNPAEVPLTDIKPVDDPQATISLTELGAKDTLYVYAPVTLTYDMSGKGDFHSVIIIYDGDTIRINAPKTGTIDVKEQRLTTGTHSLRIQALTTTGSGSLVDKIGLESILVWRDVVLIIDIDLPPVLTPQISNENGYLKFTWPSYRRKSFVKYVLTIEDWLHPRRVLTYTNPSDTAFVDSVYFGGQQLTYWFEAVNKAGTTFCPTQVMYPQYSMSGVFNPADSTVSLNWSAISYTGPFLKTTVNQNTHTIVEEVTDAEQTSMTFRPEHVVFNYPLHYSIRIYGKDGTYVNASGALIVLNPISAPVAPQLPNTFIYHSTFGPYLGLYGSQLSQVNDQWQTPQTWGLVPSPIAIPPGGPYYYTSDGQENINRTSLVDQTLTTKNILIVSSWGIMQGLQVSHASIDGKIVIRYRAHNAIGSFLVNHVSVLDFGTRQNVFHAESSGILNLPILSGDGRYFFYGNQVYSLNGTTKTLLYTLGASFSPLEFRADNGDEIFALNNGTFTVVESATGNVLRTVDLPEAGYLYSAYDVPTKNLFFVKYDSYHQYAVQVETGAVTRIDAYHGPTRYLRLRYGYIINQDGEYYRAINP